MYCVNFIENALFSAPSVLHESALFFMAIGSCIHNTFLSAYHDRGSMVGTPQIGGHLAIIPLEHMPLACE